MCIEQGDLQTCAVIALVLHNGGHPVIPNLLCRQYLNSYLEILRRNGLWNHATEILQVCPDPLDRVTNQKSTAVSVTSRCRQCNKSIELPTAVGCAAARWAKCERCGPRPIRCSLCGLGVGGAYVWCQGCGHGGHLQHIYDWFKTNSSCPAGCLHQCRPQLTS